MPGTGLRVLVWRTHEFQAASIARGSHVTMTVSSMSETSPIRASGETMSTRAVAGSASSASITTSFQPGSSPWSMTRTSM